MTTLTPGPFIWAAELITLLGIAARPSKYRRLLFLLVAPLCIYPMFLPKAATSHDNYARTGRLISLLLVSSDFLVLTDVQNELRLRNDKASPHISQRSWWSRLKWAFQLRTSMRGVGWSFEPSPEHLGPRPPVRTRWEFIIYQLIWTAFNSLALDLCVATAKTIPYFDGTGRETLATAPWPDKLLCWLYIAISYHGLLVPFRILTILSVGLGLSQPHEWPELFGNPLDAYTVRRAWGRVWQQSIRRVCTIPPSSIMCVPLD
ncbi:hypothetical protein CC1G_02367 [Coprinopsis cinerea okayama7|uniref:Wax synthase domain-containing protein n=1 Tax=Coprinopsis cinerea (strain Okayama-7 / 130 / ATCC MYA-4618 / FGSC 9003) TaxID=240176 RepID=A8N7W0_COPC7|nr:hypothetical protein CC1G_02367 [Coprinopsis cinerea okayama7\|eukprot:XP_001830916.1 hypothetical protein CC1G_02367 [Coprinopsis cinerea okayama7\